MSNFRIQTQEHAPHQLAVEGFYNDPPAHVAGKRVIVSTSPTGDFNGHPNKIAWSNGTSWFFDEPENGWLAWVESEEDYYRFEGSWELYLETEDLPTEDLPTEDLPFKLVDKDYALLYYEK